MTLILTNDDGIDAPGIRCLHRALEPVLVHRPIFVAPTQQHSGCSHRTTTHYPLAITERSPQEYAIDGTPADCTRLAIAELSQRWDSPIEWVFSGVNAGGNLGVDVYMSGTVAAVREAAFHGIPGIAISHHIKRPFEIDWERTAEWTANILTELFSQSLQPGEFWNVNIPHLEPGADRPEMVFCPVSTDPLPLVYRFDKERYHYCGKYDDRDRAPGTDVDICFSGKIAISRLRA
ncbi:5'/3'-nucleotidase SurE [Roseofilum casamattae]|uniref:5'-nucleotidase n=1 Tax=Roseofilum casamattae BLCC-M143 TaxID=3022442 RepID=A0ABT7C2E5_9CYAN|nr:5'/3'-nucleotidase SurE [Roseofilum casamattae]MDJ1185450.1 5'/3'-nucleotidase SurE [Roseofilum casamattae BLCC-M143]